MTSDMTILITYTKLVDPVTKFTYIGEAKMVGGRASSIRLQCGYINMSFCGLYAGNILQDRRKVKFFTNTRQNRLQPTILIS